MKTMSFAIMITLIIVLRSITDHSTEAFSALANPYVIDLREEAKKEGGPWRLILRGPP